MSDIKIGFSNCEHEFLAADDTITETIDVLSLFTPQFMSQYTKFDSLVDFISASGQDFTTQESWNNIQSGIIDEFVRQNSNFESWADMYSFAGNEYLKSLLT